MKDFYEQYRILFFMSHSYAATKVFIHEIA